MNDLKVFEFQVVNYRHTTQLFVLLSLTLLGCKSEPQANNLISSFEKQNKHFKVRASAFREQRSFGNALAGAKYVYEVRVDEKDDWKTIMEVQQDDPTPVDEESVVFPNNEVGCVFFLNRFAVTVDGGRNWKVTDVNGIRSISNHKNCTISQVTIEDEGKGKMALRCDGANRVLLTDDFGFRWFESN